jgi:hypothetical protein
MTTLVLIPCPLGYTLFVRWPRQRLRACSAIVAPADLTEAVRSLGDPLTVVLVGRRHADVVAHAVLHEAELVIVPDAWLRRVPRRALSARAEIAARIATAHRTAGIEHRVRREHQLELPF